MRNIAQPLCFSCTDKLTDRHTDQTDRQYIEVSHFCTHKIRIHLKTLNVQDYAVWVYIEFTNVFNDNISGTVPYNISVRHQILKPFCIIIWWKILPLNWLPFQTRSILYYYDKLDMKSGHAFRFRLNVCSKTKDVHKWELHYKRPVSFFKGATPFR